MPWNSGRSYGLTQLVLLQGGKCAYCGQPFAPLKRSSMKMRAATLDHVWPRRMGHSKANNVLAVHRICNEAKGDRMPTGCELVMLEAINAIRPAGCAGSPPSSPTMSKSTEPTHELERCSSV